MSAVSNGIRFDPQLWVAMHARAGRWALGLDRRLYLPADLRGLSLRRCVYVPMRQCVDGYVVDYVGSAARPRPGAVWQRVVGEHQRQNLGKLADWARVAVIGLREDTPVPAVRVIEAAVADLVGRPPRCTRLPVLPADWRAVLADMPAETQIPGAAGPAVLTTV